MIPKIIALYLPQFHEVKENSEWYGEGFTDWVAVKKAKPLYDGHKQPRKPLDLNYYDLSKIETIKWQAALAKKYGIDGFCFYHYWFDSHTHLLEKPAELLLQHKEIDISFCFSWANESWKRTWSNVKKGNVWCDFNDLDNKNGLKDNGLLAEQRYGREEEWKKHIEYLIPFFQDERYLKINGKPVLCIYKPCDIWCLKSMMEVWNEKLKENGIKGIYLVGASYGKLYSANVDVNYNHEPGSAFVKCREMKEYVMSPEGIEFFDYDTVWEHILEGTEYGRLSCGFTDFDASPRKGCKSTIVKGSTPAKFEQHFKEFLKKNIQVRNEIVFINAWNEWGEGMYLEPSEEHGYGYLEAIKSAVQYQESCEDSLAGMTDNNDARLMNDHIDKPDSSISKSVLQADILSQWLSAYRIGVRVEDFFNKYHYSTIAIYGMGILGRQLSEELAKSKIQILYFIDRRDVLEENLIKRISIEEELPEVDCIVVTVVAEYDNIHDIIRRKSSASIVNIGEIFENLF